ncbi:hypothetical protein ACFZDK_24490 [Streptomyces sp. NPDC007901]|uniref:hypothetical protein n=1 Tax=Streptomyces sp. NPDC007901 TaxID=3364785 RepID=UPI0036EF0F9D
MRTERQAGDGGKDTSSEASRAAVTARPAGPTGPTEHALLTLQGRAGNTATTLALQGGRSSAVTRQPTGRDRAEPGLVLPPYLMDFQAAGLSTAYGLTGHEFVGNALAAVVGHRDGTVAALAADLAGRPEAYYGQGRAFAVKGKDGKEWYDVTVTVTRAPDDRPPVFHPKDLLADAVTDPDGAPLAPVDEAESKDTKVDVQHNTAATVATTASGGSSKGAGGMAFGLAPVVPGLWLGGAALANAQPWQSSRESRSQRNVAEPRVLRSDKGSVEAPRKVRYGVRIKKQGTQHATRHAQTFHGSGTLTQRVPTEHLVPAGTEAPAAPRAVGADTARQVSLADSMAPVAVTDTAAPHQGGGGLFDAVAAVLHPSLTAPGAPGRARLYEATATATVLEDLPRLLRDGVTGEDLASKDGSSVGSYRLHAVITGMSPAWGTGGTQLRTHQQTQHTVTESAGKGRALTGGLGPAIGIGAAGNAAVLRGTAMPVAAARKARFTVAEQTVSSRQGAEVRGDKVLYLATVDLTVEGTGPRSAQMVLRPGTRVARHSMRVWMSLRADEAQSLGLPLPPGTEAGEFIEKPKRTDENGAEVDVERHLPFGALGSSVTLSQLDTGPMVRAVQQLFATDPRLAGYLPAFGTETAATPPSKEEAALQRHNHRELMAALSETNLRVNKDQLTSTGIRVRLRRKTTLHAHDVQLRVRGQLRETGYRGDTDNWLVRSHAGVTGNTQSGRSSSRSIGGLVLGQARIVPGILTGSARYERHRSGTRRNQAGPTTRTDVLTNGSEQAATFGAALRLDVDVTMTSRQRKLGRALTPDSLGQDAPEATPLAGLRLDEQDVRLVTPAEFTLDEEGKRRQDAVGDRRRAQAPRPEHAVTAEGIGDLATLVPRPSVGQPLRDWQLVETVGDGRAVRDLAFQLLSKAAARNKGVREDPALAAEGLAPRLAIEERFGPQAITAALRQAASSGWVVKNLRYPRRLAALNGAVGTRLTLTNPKFVHRGAGPGTETFVLGGHQAAGQEGQGTTSTWQFGATGSENDAEWRLGQGLSGSRTTSAGDTRSAALSGTVERNAHTPKKAPLYLVQCDLLVTMVAEVKVTGGGPYVATAARTLPAEAAVWLTEAQLPAPIRRQLKLDPEPALMTPPPSRPGPRPAEGSRAGAERAAREKGRAADTAGGRTADTAGGSTADTAGGRTAGTAGGSTADTAGKRATDIAGSRTTRPAESSRADAERESREKGHAADTARDRTADTAGKRATDIAGSRTTRPAESSRAGAERESREKGRAADTARDRAADTAGGRTADTAGKRATDIAGSRTTRPAESSRAGTERESREKGRATAASGSRIAGTTSAPGSSTSAPPRTGPSFGRGLPLGFGMVENLPNFVPLLARLRTRLVESGQQGLAEDLLPRQQLADRNDNVQRLLRVLDRDGSTGLLSGAMDGGVTVELFDGRRTPYWAVFKVNRLGDGGYDGAADDGRDLEYITAAVTQQAAAHDEGVTTGLEGIFSGSGKPEGGAGQLKSTGGAAGLGVGSGSSRRSGTAGRGQLGMKTVAEAKTAPSSKMRVPIEATLELHRGDRRLAVVSLGRQELTHRVLDKDLAALSRMTAPRPAPVAPAPGPPGARPAALGAWRSGGVRLPMEAQVNGFQGAPQIRELVNSAVREAGGGDRFRAKGQAAAYTLHEAVSTEWLIAALPLLTSAGAELPPVHATGVEGQDLRASLHARLRDGRVLGVGDKMTFETVGQSHLDAPRPTQTDGLSSADHGRSARGLAGAGLLNADEFRLNQLMGNAGGAGGGAGLAANASGSMPLHKPKFASVLVQFTLDVRVVASVSRRVRSGRAGTAVRELTLPRPVVIRMPEPVVRGMLGARTTLLQDPDDQLGLRRAAPAPPT